MPVGSALIAAFLEVVYAVLSFYVWALIVGAVLSWLVAFGVINPYKPFRTHGGRAFYRESRNLLYAPSGV
jgi:YggT family protein